MKKVRVGIVGVGMAGRFHLECLRRVYGAEVEVTGVTSKRSESSQVFAKAHGIKAYENLEALVRDVDVLDICSPPYVHESGILAAVDAGKGIICEKPLTGAFGPAGDAGFHGNKADKSAMLKEVVDRLGRIAAAVRKKNVFFGYAENFVYAPSIQKEREIIEKTGAQILRMSGEESHNGSASPVYGIWSFAGGGSLIGKGCHPLGALLYLKRVEGIARNGKPIRPVSVSARVHELTRLPGYKNAGFIRTDYRDIEDYGFIHTVFEDGTVGDITSCEIVLGGIYDYVEVFANNHRTRCNLSPIGLVNAFNPKGEQFRNIHTVEKTSTKEGWANAAPDENLTLGYQAEVQDFITCAATGGTPQSGLDLALDTTAAIYAAYKSAEQKGAEAEVPLL